MKKISLLVVGFVAGSMGVAGAQSAPAVSGTVTPSVPAKMEAHPRIYEVKDRVMNQRDRIDQGLKNKTLTDDQAKACRDSLRSVRAQMEADFKENGSKKLTEDQTSALNKLLDANSTILHEEKQESTQATAVTTPGGSM